MSKIVAKNIYLNSNNLVDKFNNLSVGFSDNDLANSDKVWSSLKVKQYIDESAQGLDVKGSVRVATIIALPSCTYDNGSSGVGATLTGSSTGALPSQDGITLVTDDRILVKNQADSIQNGIYEVTTVGDGSNPFVLTRTSDFDDSPDGEVSGGAFTFIEEGNTLENTGWVVTSIGDITVGTSDIDFSQFSGAGQITSGTGLTKDGDTIHIGDGSTGNVGGINRTANDISVATGSGLEVSGNLVRIATAAAGDGLQGGGGAALAVDVSDFAGAGLEDDGSENLRISTAAAGDGLQGGGGSALAVDVSDFAGTGLEDDGAENLRISTAAAGNGITGGSGVALAVDADTVGGTNLATVVNVSTNGVAVKIDNSTIGENASNQLIVKDGGITSTQINSSAIGDGLTGGSGTTISVVPADLITNGSVELDGDKLDIDWNPSYYTPATTPSEVNSVDNLTAHLYGIDQTFNGVSSEQFKQEIHVITSDDDSSGYFLLSELPTNAQSVRATVMNGNMQINNNVGNNNPDFDILNLSEFHINNNGAASGLSGVLDISDVLIIEYSYEKERRGMDENGDLEPYIGDPHDTTNIFEENGPNNIMPTTNGLFHDFYEIVGGEITPKI